MATLKDVARLAGVGLGTASRVVSGKGSVSPAKQEAVRKAIESLDFRPSHVARSLMSGTTQTIGVYIPVLSGTFYTPILQVIDAELRAAGMQMVVAFGSGRGGARRQAVRGIESLMERGCDGVLVMSAALQEEDLAELGAKRRRLVMVNGSFGSIPDQCFTVDHAYGGQLAARTLLEQRHRAIAVIAGPANIADNILRINGFLGELSQAGIDPAALWIGESDFSAEGGWEAANELLKSGYHFTGLFCANDEMAVGALSCFQEAGIRVPHDVSVVGYDDTPAASYAAPRLTSVHIPWREMTQSGVRMLLNICYDTDRPVKRKFPISLTTRASLARPKT